MRLGIILVGFVATIMGLTVQSVYALWFLCSDLVYVVLFPQLFCVIHFSSHTNTYGSMSGFLIGIMLRLLAGEAVFHIPPIFKYPLFDIETNVQKFPFRTFSMLIFEKNKFMNRLLLIFLLFTSQTTILIEKLILKGECFK